MPLFIGKNLFKLERKLHNFITCFYMKRMCSVQPPMVTKAALRNPYLDLQQCFEVPILKKDDICWEPTVESVTAAMDLFIPKPFHRIQRVAQAVNPSRFPNHTVPEVAFLGRSNSGKSSLLKAIFHHAPDLRIQTSKKPGHTRSLKFYNVGTHMCLVDMPGYGFRQPEYFETSVGYYLKNRKNLIKTFMLIDSRTGFHDWDDASIQMLGEMKVPFAIVLTKIDDVPDSQRLKTLLHLRKIMNSQLFITCFPQIFMLSSHTFEGLPYFISFIAHITGSLNHEEKSSKSLGFNKLFSL